MNAPDIAVPDTPPTKSRGWIIAGIVFVLALDLAFFWQKLEGAYRSEFGGHPDEAAHYVTGLFVRDAVVLGGQYAADGFHGSTVQLGKDFADHYYTHYPKIGLGVWPPFFYLVQAAWTLPFSPSRQSILLLLCMLAAALAVVLFRVLREDYGIGPASFGVALLLSLPLVRTSYGMVMAETLSALLMFGAMMAFGAFLDRERRGDVLWFGLLAALAILTKGTGLALALAAPLALLFTRKLHLLKRPALWSAVLLVLILAGPWTWVTRNMGKGGWVESSASWHFTSMALPYYLTKFGFALGLLPLLLFCLGVMVRLRTVSPQPGRWVAAGALIISAVVFQSLVPVGFEARHLVSALPAAVMFVIAGGMAIVRWAQARRGGTSASPVTADVGLLAAILMLSCLLSSILPIRAKGYSGFAPIAQMLIEDTGPQDVILVSSDARGEGMFISEVAMREARPGHTIQRASKALASSTWSGNGYAPKFDTDDDLLAFLTTGQIQYLVLDDAVPEDKRREHQEQLRRVVKQNEASFWLVASSEILRDGEVQYAPVKVYKIQQRN
jgi:hypothetical protein